MLTITEWAKLNPQPLQAGVIEIIANQTPIFKLMEFQNIAGNAYKYNREQTLPGIAFRDFNGSYTESTGVINPEIEPLTILGGDSDFDIAEIAMQSGSNNTRAIHDAMKAKAVGLTWLQTFFNGDSSGGSLQFDGLNKRLTGAQVITSGGGPNGSTLALNDLDALIDAVIGEPDILLMSKQMRQQIRHLARGTSALLVPREFFGNEVETYAGIPIAVTETGTDGNLILGANETVGSSTNCSSIYALRFGPDLFHGIQSAPISVRDLGEVQDKPAYRTRIEWYSGLALKHPRACARLQGVLAY